MRVLTVRQPWAWAIIHAGKDVENRTRSLGPYRGPVAIQAALQYDDDARERTSWEALADALAARPDAHSELARGVIVGVVDLVDEHGPHDGIRATGRGSAGSISWGTWARCSKWAEPDAHHLVFRNPRALDEPIPWKGGLGLRKSDLDVAGPWLVRDTGKCTCGPGPVLGAVYGHESGCGLEQIARLGEPA
jgi:hypothetical protein